MKAVGHTDTILELKTVAEGVAGARGSGGRVPGKFCKILEAESKRRGEGEPGSSSFRGPAARVEQVQPG